MAGRAVTSAAALWSSDWPAPAKLNLFLHVVGRRPDGYHLLQTVFRFLDYGDTLRFTPRSDDGIVITTPLPGVAPERDLTVRAATALRDAAGIRAGVEISLQKTLPVGGGLGGGSSDAATTLMALNLLWNIGAGVTLGADVPIFIHGRAAFAEGVGERFTDVSLPPAWYLVLVPPVSVPTADIFRAADLSRDTPAMAAADWRPGVGGNDLESVACRMYPEVRRHLDWLSGRTRARMTGSGACVFGEFAQESAARSACAALPPDMQGFVARGVDVHPIDGLIRSG
jgi:4-diphosphocytidyl-2-C-methyl-D-erythritol kinase